MFYYKFKISFDEVADFERDIEILATSTFESFHNFLFTILGLQGHELAAFSICDQKWNKKQEITLIDMHDEAAVDAPQYEEDTEFSTSSNIPKFIMSEAVIKNFISDPHQYIMYEYNFINPKVFYIELIKTMPVQANVEYPRCTLSMGVIPKEDAFLIAQKEEADFLADFLVDIDNDDLDPDFTDDQIWDDSQKEFDSF